MAKPDSRCILDNPETDCIASPYEQLSNLPEPNTFGTENTGRAFNIAWKYISSLTTMDKSIIKEKCGQVLGNKFLYEYGKCQDESGNIQTRYKYIDATCESGGIFGGEDPSAGLIPCTINSAMDVGGAAIGIPSAIFQDSTPNCSKINVPCKVSNKGKSTFNGMSGTVYIQDDDYGGKNNLAPGAEQGFENLYESVNDYMKNNDLNFNNVHENDIIDNNFKNDSTLNEMYYIMLMIFFLFIIYKLMHKK